jgi:uncharacterized iron-regulated membrane protein
MKPLRKVLFWLHLVIGLLAGGTIAITAFTGASMAFEKQLIAWAERDLRRVDPPAASVAKLSVDELLRKLREAQPEARPMSLTVSADPAAAVVVNLGRTNTVYANPYTGEFRSQDASQLRAFFQLMLRWHRWLGVNAPPRAEAGATGGEGPRANAGGEGPGRPNQPAGPRQIASTVVGVSAIVFFTLCVSGLWLWWPRSWSFRALRATSVVNRKLRGKARDWNWHNAVGLWCAPIILVMSFTGVVMAFRGFGNVVYGPPPGGPGAGGTNAPTFTAPTPGTRPLGSDALLAAVYQEVPTWESITLRFGQGRQRGGGMGRGEGNRLAPERVDGRGEGAVNSEGGERRERGPRGEGAGGRGSPAVTALVQVAGSWSPTPRQLQLHPFSGEILKREAFGDQGVRRSLRQLNRTLHTGEAGGWPGQALALLGCLGGLVLVYTGFALAWRRFFPRRAIAAPAGPEVSSP